MFSSDVLDLAVHGHSNDLIIVMLRGKNTKNTNRPAMSAQNDSSLKCDFINISKQNAH